MTDEINPSELGAFTNNLSNKEGIKKLCAKVNEGGSGTTYTAGENIQISPENVISATDTKYTAGENIAISEENVISATDTKYTAGTGITIIDNIISAVGGSGEWTLRTPNNDWTDMFDTSVSGKVKTKKDIIIFTSDYYMFYLPKGITTSAFILTIPVREATSNKHYTFIRVQIYNSRVDSSSPWLEGTYDGASFTTDGTTITCVSSAQTNNMQKNSFTIYTKD